MLYAVHCTRGRRGYALVSTLVVGLLSTALLLSLSSFLVSVSQSESARRHKAEMRHAAEAAIEYALGDLGTGSPTLDTTPGMISRTTVVPTSMLIGTAGGVSNAAVLSQMNVSVTVRALTETEMSQFKDWSPLYSRSLDPSNAASITYDKNNLDGDYTLWRVIDAKATMGGIARTVRVVAEPMFELTVDKVGSSSNKDSYFRYGAFGDSLLDLNGAEKISWAGSSPIQGGEFQLSVATNGDINLGPESIVQGNVKKLLNAGVLDMQKSSWIYGQLEATGNISQNAKTSIPLDTNPGDERFYRSQEASIPDYTHSNILNGGDGLITISDGNATLNQSAGLGSNQIVPSVNAISALPPVPVGADARSLPSVQELAQSGGQITSSSGNWKTSSLSTDGLSPGAGVNVSDVLVPSDSSSPNRIFIDDSRIDGSASPNAVSIDTSIFRHETDPTSLQIWYDGTKPVDVSIPATKSFAATIFAPNASVTIRSGGTFLGSVVGKTFSVQDGVKMKLLTDFSDNAAGPAKDSGLSFSNGSSSSAPPPTGYRIVTWQEIN